MKINISPTYEELCQAFKVLDLQLSVTWAFKRNGASLRELYCDFDNDGQITYDSQMLSMGLMGVIALCKIDGNYIGASAYYPLRNATLEDMKSVLGMFEAKYGPNEDVVEGIAPEFVVG